jgi:HlyD family secretion protein
MQKEIFPKEIAEFSTEVYLPKVSVKGQSIYLIILATIFLVFVALPIIKVDVSVQSKGVLKSIYEKNEVKSLVSGIIQTINFTENTFVKQGDTLIALQTNIPDEKIKLNSAFLNEKINLINDLQKLTNIRSGEESIYTNSPFYTQQYNQFKILLLEKKFQLQKAKMNFDRQKYLYEQKVVSTSEWEEADFLYKKTHTEYNSLIASQKSQWQADLQKLIIEVQELRTQNTQINAEKHLYFIKAPISGTIQEKNGKYVGSPIQIGETLAVISPDSLLIAECYISPSDIGLLKPSMKAKFQIDAFNYNQWGIVEGEILEISQDFVLLEQKPFFKVKCKLHQNTLSLQNGFKGTLKKGMTLNTRFIITQRSLWQLLYDKIDNWLNPNNK